MKVNYNCTINLFKINILIIILNNGSKLHEYQQSTYWICLLSIKRTYLICISFLLNYRYRDVAHNNSGARFAYISAVYNHLM